MPLLLNSASKKVIVTVFYDLRKFRNVLPDYVKVLARGKVRNK